MTNVSWKELAQIQNKFKEENILPSMEGGGVIEPRWSGIYFTVCVYILGPTTTIWAKSFILPAQNTSGLELMDFTNTLEIFYTDRSKSYYWYLRFTHKSGILLNKLGWGVEPV